MERLIEKDLKFRKPLIACKVIYLLTAIAAAILGMIHKSSYETLLAIATLIAFPCLYFIRRIFRFEGGYQLETYIYIFTWLSWSLGGATEFYSKVPYYDKAVHFLSGVFVSMLALALYYMLERRHSKEGESKLTPCIFTFSVSMAVAGIFELCEFTLAPIVKRDLQQVERTGVADTMGDMFVCMLGTLIVILLMTRDFKGKSDIFTDAAKAFACQNPAKEEKQ